MGVVDETTGRNVDGVEELWTHVMRDSEDEGWLYAGCGRLKDDETCWNDDGVTSIGKDEIKGA